MKAFNYFAGLMAFAVAMALASLAMPALQTPSFVLGLVGCAGLVLTD